MNREILFKAKRVDNGEWVEGSLYVMDWESDYVYIIKPYTNASTLTMYGLIRRSIYLVDKNTVCQCTGLTDTNGEKIWENDIVLFEKYKAIIKFEKGQYMMKWLNRTYFRKDLYFFTTERKNDIQVIGNIFDNADLLEVE